MSDYANPVKNYTHSAPLAKNDPITANDEIPKLRDFRALTQENLDGDTIRFFPPNPRDRDSVERAYEDNPLPRNTRKQILSVGFAFNKLAVEESSGVTPHALVNDVVHSEVRIEKDQGRQVALEQHMKRYLDTQAINHQHATVSDGSMSKELVELPVEPLFRVDDASGLVLGPDERFEFEVELRSTDNIPAAADTDLKLGAFLQIKR